MGFFHSPSRTPIRRIAVVAFLAVSVTSCNKLGLGSDAASPTAPSDPPAPGATIVYSALGASDANGVGSSAPCVPFDQQCAGKGYVYVTANRLRTQGFTVNLTNLGIATAVIGRDFQVLGQQYNHTAVANFIEGEVPFVSASSTVVSIFAGINEINTITAAVGAGAAGSDSAGYMDNQVRAFGNDYATLLSGIRTKAGAARVVILNVPNAAGLPYLAGTSAAQRQAAQRLAVNMTRTVINPLASRTVTVIDLMCDARSYQSSNYSSDGMHPNDAGYAFIAAEVERAITSSSYPTPQSSCPPMTLVQ